MPDAIGDLTRALDAEDPAAARQGLRDLPPEVAGAEGLDVLAAAASGGSALAVELFVEQLDATGVVHRFVRGALLDESAIDDVAQDSLISVASSIGSFTGASKATTWVHSIVRRRVTDHLRRQRATTPLPQDDLGPGERMSSMIATRATVREALAGLPDLYREPVTLRDIEGLPYAEVSERLDRSIGTVKSQVARGRALVAAALGSTGEGER
ncbi:RNA polymerase sigma-70 factor, ECF subfamily [Ruania alba]|uniref:RNA polymerase sigma-70 factor, ECF subfamily n=2 Tax=Ruania alba TaxID=648782 RepID=A0A1H5LAP6_9MICO|nr:RNA polymerase sigma-70 factor, ECF subfamily [Ruania alba]